MSAALPVLIAGALLLAVTAYSTAGGVDFGAGIWDLLAGRREDARRLIDHAMAPVWEVNNVWLVFAIVICWTGFPVLFEAVFLNLYPLFALALVGLILRGAFFAFRHAATDASERNLASGVFGASSVLTPFFFASVLGAIASGRIAAGSPSVPVWQASFSPMSAAFGLVSLVATAFIGAVFLTADARRSDQPELVAYFRRRTIAGGLLLMAAGSLALGAVAAQAPNLLRTMLIGAGLPFALTTMVLTPVVVVLAWRRVYAWSRVLAVAAVGSLVLAWGFGQAPYLLPGQLTIAQAAAPPATEVLLVIVAAVVVLGISPALALLIRLDQQSALQPPH